MWYNNVNKRSLGDCWQWKANGHCSKEYNCSFRHDANKRAENDTAESISKFFHAEEWEKCVENPKSQKQESQWENVSMALQWLPEGTCTNSFCKKVTRGKIPQMHIVMLMKKRSKKNDDKNAVAMLKKNDLHESIWQLLWTVTKVSTDRFAVKLDTCHELKRGPTGRRSSDARQLGSVFQDMTPPKSILRKSTDMQRPIQRVTFTKAIALHTEARDQNPSLGYICPGEPHERSPNAPKFEDRTQEETEWQEQDAREAAWKLAKNVFKLKEHQRATFFSSPGK